MNGIWLGAADDVIMRARGVEFVDGSAPGFAAVVGAAPDNETAVKLAREMQEKILYVFMARPRQRRRPSPSSSTPRASSWAGTRASCPSAARSTARSTPSASRRARPWRSAACSPATTSASSRTTRAASSPSCSRWARSPTSGTPRRPAPSATASRPSPRATSRRSCPPASAPTSTSSATSRCDELVAEGHRGPRPQDQGRRGPRSRSPTAPPSRASASARKTCTSRPAASAPPRSSSSARWTHPRSTTARSRSSGPELDDIEEGARIPLGIVVDVSGRKMQSDFEPVIERQFHHLMNFAEGVLHMGQRDLIWIRISKAAKDKGFKFEHLGEILHAKILDEFDAIVDKVQVTIYTDAGQGRRDARASRASRYAARDERMAGPHRRHGRRLLLVLAVPELRAHATSASSRPSASACAARTTGSTPRPPTSSTPPAPTSPSRRAHAHRRRPRASGPASTTSSTRSPAARSSA